MANARAKLVAMEAAEVAISPEQWADPDYQPWTKHGSPWWHWFQGMVRHPGILSAAQSILGPNLLIRNADIFVKPIGKPQKIRWHVDCTAPTEEAGRLATAWIAISDATIDNGAMAWLPHSHTMPLPPEIQDKHSLSFSAEHAAKLDMRPKVSNTLSAGQMSLHHFRTVHQSGNNLTQTPRIGLVIRFMAADASVEAADSGKGMLVSGENSPGHFLLVDDLPVSWRRCGSIELI